MTSPAKQPQRLETFIMVISFVDVWLYFVARHRAIASGTALPVWMSVFLILLLLALVWVFVRRLQRIGRAMKESEMGTRKR